MELTELKGVGPAVKIKLEKLNIKTQSDLLFLLPTRYENRTFIKDIGSLVPDEEAQIEGTVLVCNIVYRGRRMLVVQLADETGILTLRFFTFSKYQAAGLKPNTTVRCFGKTRQAGSGVEMIHPSYQIIDNNYCAMIDSVWKLFMGKTDKKELADFIISLYDRMLRKMMKD